MKLLNLSACLVLTFFLLTLILLVPVRVLAAGDSFTQKDRDLIIRLDERLNQMDKRFEQIDKRFEQVDKRISELRQDINKRFEQIDKRFEQVDKRFEQIDKRFEQINMRFETLQDLMIAIIGAFAAIVAVAIGFAIWDRRTMIRPFEYKVKEIDSRISDEQNKIDRIIEVLRQLAKEDKRIEAILRNLSLL